ncbi:MAG: glycosyl transferase family 1 [Sphingomonadales bacterium RIFCSPHIGHO2_01_FULL_65_20]|uniref:glycosyltransferase family 4 protein n=1 Tax=unclassified Blastomonas TaxID=2626550 RepID=UPI00082B9076|nr:glycosyltransferase family 4 protein [Blastomonas sp.]MCH2237816.1 glycosyltransferase family 4 protein [Blastomonas sp.]OHC97226.1 MAG: glycosyl transferase family 1 [Sphingomonadales bacterium RIFCSPHIGHO2_01_FULL_65_20]
MKSTTRPARILHLHSTFDLGGKEARAVRLMNHFGQAAQHTILTAVPDALGARAAIAPGIRADFPNNAPSLAGKPNLARYRKFADYFANFDLILSYNWGAMDGVMARTIFNSITPLPPVIHHEDGFNEDEAVKLKAKRNWFRMVALARTDALVVPSHTLEQIALKVWKQPDSRVRRISNGIDVAAYAKRPQKGAIPGFQRRDGEIVIGTLAGLRAVKNLPQLVRAVAALDRPVRLVIVGEGPERAAIEAEAARLGIADRLLMPGFLKNPARYVGLFDIFALSSDSEQQPISVMEAMAAGLPVAAPMVGDVAHMVAADNAILLGEPGSEAGLIDNLRRLAEDPALRTALGNANRAKAEAEFDERLMLERYAALYGRAMGRPEFGR